MIKAKIKTIDVVGDLLHDLNPDEYYCFCFQTTIAIGKENETGSDYFYLLVCTPRWLEKENRKKDIWANNMLIVPKWNPKDIEDTIKRKIESMTADSWEQLATKISRFALWEFEDYVQLP